MGDTRGYSSGSSCCLVPLVANADAEGFGKYFASSNGRIEATEIDVAAKIPGRIDKILVNEGDFVNTGQIVAVMDLKTLKAQLDRSRS